MKTCLSLLILLSISLVMPSHVYAENSSHLTEKEKAAIASSLDDDEEYLDTVAHVIPDPLEGWNRAVYSFNEAFLDYGARPLYSGYAYVTPSFFRQGVKNFFHNIAFPIRFVNNLLQGKGRAAGVEMSSFILNTTVGLGGFLDVAKNHKPIVPRNNADTGQTLGVWGMGEGFYLVWPFLGPSTVRESLGLAGDYFLYPITYVSPKWLSTSLAGISYFNQLDDILDAYDTMRGMSVEPYSSTRDAYIQYRRAKIEK